jgi:hypothetical protein
METHTTKRIQAAPSRAVRRAASRDRCSLHTRGPIPVTHRTHHLDWGNRRALSPRRDVQASTSQV